MGPTTFRRAGKATLRRAAPIAFALALPLTYVAHAHLQDTPRSAGAQEKYHPLVSRLQSSLQDRSDPGKRYKVSLTFVSQVEYLPDTKSYQYSYSVKKESAVPIRVVWHSLQESSVSSTSWNRRAFYQGGVPFVTKSPRSPRVQRFGAEIYASLSAEGEELVMTSPAPAYVPD